MLPEEVSGARRRPMQYASSVSTAASPGCQQQDLHGVGEDFHSPASQWPLNFSRDAAGSHEVWGLRAADALEQYELQGPAVPVSDWFGERADLQRARLQHLRVSEARALADQEQIEMLRDRLQLQQAELAARSARVELLQHEHQIIVEKALQGQQTAAFALEEISHFRDETLEEMRQKDELVRVYHAEAAGLRQELAFVCEARSEQPSSSAGQVAEYECVLSDVSHRELDELRSRMLQERMLTRQSAELLQRQCAELLASTSAHTAEHQLAMKIATLEQASMQQEHRSEEAVREARFDASKWHHELEQARAVLAGEQGAQRMAAEVAHRELDELRSRMLQESELQRQSAELQLCVSARGAEHQLELRIERMQEVIMQEESKSEEMVRKMRLDAIKWQHEVDQARAALVGEQDAKRMASELARIEVDEVRSRLLQESALQRQTAEPESSVSAHAAEHQLTARIEDLEQASRQQENRSEQIVRQAKLEAIKWQHELEQARALRTGEQDAQRMAATLMCHEMEELQSRLLQEGEMQRQSAALQSDASERPVQQTEDLVAEVAWLQQELQQAREGPQQQWTAGILASALPIECVGAVKDGPGAPTTTPEFHKATAEEMQDYEDQLATARASETRLKDEVETQRIAQALAMETSQRVAVQEVASLSRDHAAALSSSCEKWEEEVAHLEKLSACRLVAEEEARQRSEEESQIACEALRETSSLRSAIEALRKERAQLLVERLDARKDCKKAKDSQLYSTKRFTRIEWELTESREEALRESRALTEAEASSRVMYDMYKALELEWQEWDAEKGDGAGIVVQRMSVLENALEEASQLRLEVADKQAALAHSESQVSRKSHHYGTQEVIARRQRRSTRSSKLSGLEELPAQTEALPHDLPQKGLLLPALRRRGTDTELEITSSKTLGIRSSSAHVLMGEGSNADDVTPVTPNFASGSAVTSRRRPGHRRGQAPRPAHPRRRGRPASLEPKPSEAPASRDKVPSSQSMEPEAEDNIAVPSEESGMDLTSEWPD